MILRRPKDRWAAGELSILSRKREAGCGGGQNPTSGSASPCCECAGGALTGLSFTRTFGGGAGLRTGCGSARREAALGAGGALGAATSMTCDGNGDDSIVGIGGAGFGAGASTARTDGSTAVGGGSRRSGLARAGLCDPSACTRMATKAATAPPTRNGATPLFQPTLGLNAVTSTS